VFVYTPAGPTPSGTPTTITCTVTEYNVSVRHGKLHFSLV
jgi:hypothetical protein